jgi:hypothetical protein
MTFTYDGSLATDVEKVRFDIGDTQENDGPRPDSSNYSDEEITAIIAQEGNFGKAIARMYEVLAAEWSAAAGRVEMADYKEDYTKRAEMFMAKAKDARRRWGDSIRTANITQVAPTRVDGFSDDIDANDT